MKIQILKTKNEKTNRNCYDVIGFNANGKEVFRSPTRHTTKGRAANYLNQFIASGLKCDVELEGKTYTHRAFSKEFAQTKKG